MLNWIAPTHTHTHMNTLVVTCVCTHTHTYVRPRLHTQPAEYQVVRPFGFRGIDTKKKMIVFPCRNTNEQRHRTPVANRGLQRITACAFETLPTRAKRITTTTEQARVQNFPPANETCNPVSFTLSRVKSNLSPLLN